MAEQRNGFLCRRLDKPGDYAGYEGTHTQWKDEIECERWCRPETPDQIVPVVAYIGPDAPQWRERPTCTGKYINRWSEIHDITRSILDLWDDLDGYQLAGPWFGPLPAIPEELK